MSNKDDLKELLIPWGERLIKCFDICYKERKVVLSQSEQEKLNDEVDAVLKLRHKETKLKLSFIELWDEYLTIQGKYKELLTSKNTFLEAYTYSEFANMLLLGSPFKEAFEYAERIREMEELKFNKDKYLYHTGSFEPIEGKILILGSRATLKSLKRGMYYTSNKNGNIFWEVLDEAFKEGKTNFKELQEILINTFDKDGNVDSIIVKMKAMLRKIDVGLSDVLFECDSTDSLDSSIKNGVVNPNLYELCKKANVVLLNGTKAGSEFKKAIKNWDVKVNYKIMPSTSSMQGKHVKPKAEKIRLWIEAINPYKK